MAGKPRPFSRATNGGNRPGRPTNKATYQFAGDSDRLGPDAKRLIASQRWNQSTGREKPETAPIRRSSTSGAEVSFRRGESRQERRFAGERGFFSPDSAAEGGSGTSPRNPWA